METIVLASTNEDKLNELRYLLSNISLNIISQTEFSLSPITEIGLTFVENAILKARNVCNYTGLSAIADDSGLIVDALNGAPGVYSARYAGSNATYQDNIKKLLFDMRHVAKPERTAKFYCVAIFLKNTLDSTPIICEGVWEGSILSVPRGKNGFGYDSIFFVPTHDCAAAELPAEIKNKISHRAQALSKLAIILENMKKV